MFSDENTSGYSDDELSIMNEILSRRISQLPEIIDLSERHERIKQISEEILDECE